MTGLVDAAVLALAPAVTKLLTKAYLGDKAAEITGPLAQVLSSRFGEMRKQRELARKLESLADHVVTELALALESERIQPATFEGIAKEIEAALESRLKAHWLLERNLAASQIRDALFEAHSLPPAQYDQAEQQVYGRSLEYLSHILARLAPELPDYARERDAEILRRFDDLNGSITGVGKQLASRLPAIDDLHRWAHEDREYRKNKGEGFAEIYSRSLIERLDYVELIGVDVHKRARRAKLSVAYIELDIDLESGAEDASGFSRGFQSLLDGLTPNSRCLLVLGQAGSGKSTLLRWAALTAAERRSQAEPPADGDLRWRDRVPLLLYLRDLQSPNLPTPNDWPFLIDRELQAKIPESWVEDILDAGQGLVMIDGFDEVPPDQRDLVMESIERCVRRFPAAFFILTSRPAAVDDGRIASLGFTRASVAALTPTNRERFIDHWHEALRGNLTSEEAGLDTGGMAAKLKNALGHNGALALLASNPLLCAAICALHHFHDSDEAELPDRLAPLCEEVCKMLLHRRERVALKRRIDEFPACYARMTYEHKREIVSEIAKSMMAQELSSLPRGAVLEIVQTGLARLDEGWSGNAGELLDVLVMRSGMLRPSGRDEIAFIHNTLKEYLAAPKLVGEGYLETFLRKSGDSSWQPVIVFACALAGRDFTDKLIGRLLDVDAEVDTDVRSRYFLAIRCAEAALGSGGLAPALQRKAQKARAALFPPQKLKEAELLAELGNAAITYLRPTKQLRAVEAAACIRTLRIIGTEPALAALKAFADDKRIKVRAEFIRTPNGGRFLPPEKIQKIKDYVFGSTDVNVPRPEELAWLDGLDFLFEGVSPEDVKRLSLVGVRLRGLGFLTGFHNVTSLDLSYTQVSDIGPIAELTGLQSLDLSFTQVSDLRPITGLTGLQSLDLSSPQVSDIGPIAGLTELQSLNLLSTQVSDIGPIAGLTGLQSLSLSSPQVSDIGPIASLTGLQSLRLSSPQVSDIGPIAGLTGLQSLSLSNNQVSDIGPIAGLTGLQSLDLSLTLVSDIGPISGLTGLRSLDLWNTQISDIGPIAGLTGLRSLVLWNTRISDIGPIAGLAGLQSLHLSYSQVSDLRPIAGLTGLQSLHLSYSQVSDLRPIAGLAGLQSLHLSAAQVSDLRPIAGLAGLQSLHLSATQVSDLRPIAGLTGLQSLDLSATQVSDLRPIAGLTGLQSLDLSATQVNDLRPIAGLTKLRVLDLRGTQVSDIGPIAELADLQSLDLRGTQVKELAPIAGLSGLLVKK
ncbi:leucine-rich repeat domain-containing protein [Skermanella rosea]|uniref:leucine-rich repeat domain-containing protein n=1 Tax=Skermanella rosea TaxID=1817965 RepID=UPI0019340E61|nr:leucine-rich repeat domain-containing protein [Skermanella rosea]UEM01863.1 leucine-rich repeat domain-containing protein [Skermanella rosea]